MNPSSLAATSNAKTEFSRRLPDSCPAVLMYHSVDIDGGYDNVSLDDFREQITWLNERYEVVDLSDVLDISSNGTKKVALTFDDGLASFYENARPVLEEFDTPATVFVLAAAVDPSPSVSLDTIVTERLQTPERLMSTEELADLAEHPLFTIGAHTETHSILPWVDDAARLAAEVVEAKETLESHLDIGISQFAYPGNRWDNRSYEVVRRTYEYAVCGGGLTSPIRADTCPHLIPRISGGTRPDRLQSVAIDAGKRLTNLYWTLF